METMIVIIIGVLFTLVQAFFWNTINRLQKKVDELEKEVSNQKTNYTKRFDEVKDLISEKHEKTMEAIKKIEITLTAHISYDAATATRNRRKT